MIDKGVKTGKSYGLRLNVAPQGASALANSVYATPCPVHFSRPQCLGRGAARGEHPGRRYGFCCATQCLVRFSRPRCLRRGDHNVVTLRWQTQVSAPALHPVLQYNEVAATCPPPVMDSNAHLRIVTEFGTTFSPPKMDCGVQFACIKWTPQIFYSPTLPPLSC